MDCIQYKRVLLMKRMCFSWIVIVLLSCKSDAEKDSYTPVEEITSKSAEIILRVQNESRIAIPLRIAATQAGFALYDYGLHQIQLFSTDGTFIRSFGNEGKGPGEFKNISTIKTCSSQIIVSDSKLLRQTSFDSEGNLQQMYDISSTLFASDNAIIGPGKYITPTNGEEKSLAKFVDRNHDREFIFGKPVVDSPGFADINKWRRDISSGKVPDFFRNQIAITGNESYWYLFLQTEGILQQYNTKGEQIWEKKLILPEFEAAFDRFIENEIVSSGGNISILRYVNKMELNNDGVYLLLRTPKTFPLSLLFVDHEGEKVRMFRFTDIQNAVNEFSISPNGKWIYFVDGARGIIYRSRIPD